MGSRTWIKIYCDRWLDGTLRQDSLELRGVWIDLLALAGSGRYGDIGEVKLAPNMGMNDNQIAAILRVDEGIWNGAKEQLIQTGRISVTDGNVIHITNWKKYQSEYERQKKSRNKKLQPEVTTASYGEKEKEKRKRKRKERDETEPPISPLGGFDQFWEAYPKRVAKGRAEKAWAAMNPDEELLTQILEGVDRAKRSEQWNKDGGKFIPYPATWLRAKGWLDEIPESSEDSWPVR